jgi:SAM-dependent methyltransferase
MALVEPTAAHVRQEQVASVPEVQLRLLQRFMAEAPFQPSTNWWRAVELPVIAAALPMTGRGLDVGCGDGVLTGILAELVGGQWELIGIDPNADETASAKSSGLYAQVHTTGADRIPEPDASFDFAFANSVLEHIPNLSDCLTEIARCLKPGGSFLATVPSPYFHECLRGPRWARSSSRADYLKETDERLAHFHYWSEEDWFRELQKAGFQPEPVSVYLTLRQVRRWEFWSNCTGGLLYRLYGRGKKPIEIQRGLGLRRGLPRVLRPFAIPIARIVSRGLRGEVEEAQEKNGCFLIKAIKQADNSLV